MAKCLEITFTYVDENEVKHNRKLENLQVDDNIVLSDDVVINILMQAYEETDHIWYGEIQDIVNRTSAIRYALKDTPAAQLGVQGIDTGDNYINTITAGTFKSRLKQLSLVMKDVKGFDLLTKLADKIDTFKTRPKFTITSSNIDVANRTLSDEAATQSYYDVISNTVYMSLPDNYNLEGRLQESAISNINKTLTNLAIQKSNFDAEVTSRSKDIVSKLKSTYDFVPIGDVKQQLTDVLSFVSLPTVNIDSELKADLADLIIHVLSVPNEVLRPFLDNLSKGSSTQGPIISTITTINSLGDFTNHSGGAEGSDAAWHIIGDKYGLKNNRHYLTPADPEVADAELRKRGVRPVVTNPFDDTEGQQHATVAARKMGRIEPTHQVRNTKLIRNWSQVKYADAIFAIGTIIEPGAEMNYGKKARVKQVAGGTGYAVQMAIDVNKPVYVFDQVKEKWFTWNGTDFVVTDIPKLTKNFAGIGTRQINAAGKKAIEDVFKNTLGTPPATILTNDLISSVNKELDWGVLKDLPVFTERGINTMRKSGSNEHFGNPFTGTNVPGSIQLKNINEAVKAYSDWLRGDISHITDKNGNDISLWSYDPQKKWILEQIANRDSDLNKALESGKPLLYMNRKVDGKEYYSHADALYDFIQEQNVTEPAAAEVIALEENFTRDGVQNDPDYLYLFTDNAERTSGNNPVSTSSNYYQKYADAVPGPISYPSVTQAIIRGLDNAYPITTMVDFRRTQWTDDMFDIYKAIIDDEIETIKQALPNFKGLKFGAQMSFGMGQISNMANTAPRIWSYLNEKLEEIGIDNTGDVPTSVSKSVVEEAQEPDKRRVLAFPISTNYKTVSEPRKSYVEFYRKPVTNEEVVVKEYGKPIIFDFLPNYTFYLYSSKGNKNWSVIEESTGMSIGAYGSTQKEAISQAEAKLMEHKDVFAEVLAKYPSIYKEEPPVQKPVATGTPSSSNSYKPSSSIPNSSNPINKSSEPPFSKATQTYVKSAPADKFRLNSLINKLSNSYGLNFKPMTTEQIAQEYDGDGNYTRSIHRAFIDGNGNIVINIDFASLAEPIHELGHFVLSGLKVSNNSLYKAILQKARTHPDYLKISNYYQELNEDQIAEEVFVTVLGERFNGIQLSNKNSSWAKENEGFIGRVIRAIKNWFAEIFGIDNFRFHDLAPEELMNMTFNDIFDEFSTDVLNGRFSDVVQMSDMAAAFVNSDSYLRNRDGERSSLYTRLLLQGIDENLASNVWLKTKSSNFAEWHNGQLNTSGDGEAKVFFRGNDPSFVSEEDIYGRQDLVFVRGKLIPHENGFVVPLSNVKSVFNADSSKKQLAYYQNIDDFANSRGYKTIGSVAELNYTISKLKDAFSDYTFTINGIGEYSFIQYYKTPIKEVVDLRKKLFNKNLITETC